MKQIDILVSGEILVTHPDDPPIPEGAVAIQGDTVVDAGPLQDFKKKYTSKKSIERESGLIIPGLINAHTHAAMTLFRGMADDLPLKTWLTEHIFPAEARLTKELVALGTELACAEMIRSGSVGFVDMYFFEDTIGEVVDRTGLRAWLGEGILDFPTPAFPTPEKALLETERLQEKWDGHPRVSIVVAPHTPYTCDERVLKETLKTAEKLDAIVITHLSETAWEVEEIIKRKGMPPVEYLDGLGLLSERLLATHCVVLSDQEIQLLAERGVHVAHTPESNLKLGSGVAPIPDFLKAGVNVALGTDGAASNNDLDLLGEMDTASKIPKGVRRDPTIVSARDVFSMATIGSARALHRNDLGHLRKGAKADVAVIDLNQVHLRPCYNPISQLVYASSGGDVQDVIVAGKVLMEDRELLTINEKDLLQRIQEVFVMLKESF